MYTCTSVIVRAAAGVYLTNVLVCARYATAVNCVFDRWNVHWVNSLCLYVKTQSPEPRLQIIETVCSLPLCLPPASPPLLPSGDNLFKPPCIVWTSDHAHTCATKSKTTSFSLHFDHQSTLNQCFPHHKMMLFEKWIDLKTLIKCCLLKKMAYIYTNSRNVKNFIFHLWQLELVSEHH